MGGFTNIARNITEGIANASGNTGVADRLAASVQAQRQQQLQLKTAPLSQALQADRVRLASFVDPKTLKPLPGHEDDYSTTLNRMADTIGQLRSLMGDKAPSDDPSRLKMAAAGLLDRTHITRDLEGHVRTGQTNKANAYHAQNRNLAVDEGIGVGPTPEQQYQQTTGHVLTPEDAELYGRKQLGIAPTVHPNYKNFRTPDGRTVTLDANQSIPDGYTLETTQSAAGLKPIVSAGVPVGITYQGKSYLPSQMDSAPPEVKEAWTGLTKGMEGKIEQREKERKEQYVEMEKRQRISIAAANQRAMYQFQNTLAMTGVRPAQSILQKQEQQVYADQSLQQKLTELLPEALAGNQQAQLAVLANHIAMTTHQPGASMRPTKALFDEAASSAPWMQNIEKQVGPDGVLQGVKLSPEQIQNMVALAPMVTESDTKTLEQMRSDLGGTLTPTPAQAQPPAGPHTQHLKSLSGGKPLVQHSASTGQYRYSLDGGKTWTPGQPPKQ